MLEDDREKRCIDDKRVAALMFVILCIVMLGVILVVVLAEREVTTGEPVYFTDTEVGNVVTLPLHVAERLEDYEDKLIDSDPDADIAYMDMSDKPKLKQGDIVSLDDGREFPIIDTCYTGFYIDDAVEPVKAGDSGSTIWYNNTIVGYISTNLGSGKVYCIWDI